MSQTVQAQRRLGQNLIALVFILFFFLITALSVRHKSLTVDEPIHYHYGQNILNLKSDRLGDGTAVVDDSKMPISALNALPAKLAELLPEGRLKTLLGTFFMARLMTVLFSCLTAWIVFSWSRSRYGFVAGIASLSLFVFDPNLIAHSQLVTTDMYAAGMIAASFYWLWRFANSRRLLDGVVCVVMVGLAQLAKFTAVVLLPLMLIALVLHDWADQARAVHTDGPVSIGRYLGRLIGYLAVVLLACLLIVNLGYIFNRSFQPFGNYEFRSASLQSLQQDLPVLGGIPVPVPYPYLQGLDLISFRQSTGFGYGRPYLLGQLGDAKGFPDYFIIASLLKVPIASQLVLLGVFIAYLSDRRLRSHFQRDDVFLLVPFLFFTIYFNFFFRTQIGIRFYLVVFPLLYVFAGRLFQNWQEFSARQKFGVYALAAYLSLSVLSYYPHYLSYFNEIVYDRKFAYKYLADSNLDWGQDKIYLQQYLTEHPGVTRAPETPARINRTKIYFVSASRLVGVTADPHDYEWLRNNFEPADMITPSYPLFKITPEQMDAFCQATSYCK